ncbi:helix-turn-helix domain-containing protein [Nonomuraea sp. NPDC049714]|uniref:helix-turn-helix domain-containing protein n=1 Tax=Nonomuraea sp. NPDC049714 TaxID=3364357 RepID=UPI0037B425B0
MAARRNAPKAPLLHTILETAELLRCGRDKVYELIVDGDLEAVDIARKGSKRTHLRVPDASIQAYIAKLPRVLTP